MSKKNKSFSVAQQNIKFPFPLPEVHNMDEIGYFVDELLHEKINKLEGERMRLLELKLEPTPWEVEIAYLRREQQIRKARSENHEKYQQNFSSKVDEDEVFDATPKNINSTFSVLN